MRLMVGQELGLEYLIQLAIEVLEQNNLAERDFYAGDLLKSVLSINKDYWKIKEEQKDRLMRVINSHIREIKSIINEFLGSK
ncbi:contact-dependent growth inhibition system immunity protein [Brassicibacter mesophilus]|uniref:contact-dependent growth inhibition system immunity protein n=1 Tax=Brassicibacter mesophilus TaxID=745119 RepID=UPI003D2414C7